MAGGASGEGLKVAWKPGPGLPAQRDFYEYMRKQPSRDFLLVDSKDVDEKLKAAPHVLKATYRIPIRRTARSARRARSPTCRRTGDDLVAHAVRVSDAARHRHALGLPSESVRVIFVRGSGCYGLNGADTVSYDAALLSQAVGRPVRVQLTRQDEMAWENYGSAYVIEQQAGIDASGAIVAWDCVSWSASLGNRPGYERPGNVITGMLAGFEPETVSPRAAVEPTRPLRNGSNAVPSYVAGCVGGPVRRRRLDPQRARADAHRGLAFLYRAAALAIATAEHVRARVLHGRDLRPREGGSGRVPAAASERDATHRGGEGRGAESGLGRAAVAPARQSRTPAAPSPGAASRASRTRATTGTLRSSPKWR